MRRMNARKNALRPLLPAEPFRSPQGSTMYEHLFLHTGLDEEKKHAPLSAAQARAVAGERIAVLAACSLPRDEEVARKALCAACGQAEPPFFEPSGRPTLHLARTAALFRGNVRFGLREESGGEWEAFAWDMERNVRAVRLFTPQRGEDGEREGARRLTAVLLDILPPSLLEEVRKNASMPHPAPGTAGGLKNPPAGNAPAVAARNSASPAQAPRPEAAGNDACASDAATFRNDGAPSPENAPASFMKQARRPAGKRPAPQAPRNIPDGGENAPDSRGRKGGASAGERAAGKETIPAPLLPEELLSGEKTGVRGRKKGQGSTPAPEQPSDSPAKEAQRNESPEAQNTPAPATTREEERALAPTETPRYRPELIFCPEKGRERDSLDCHACALHEGCPAYA